jgi:hypothetical protein
MSAGKVLVRGVLAWVSTSSRFCRSSCLSESLDGWYTEVQLDRESGIARERGRIKHNIIYY